MFIELYVVPYGFLFLPWLLWLNFYLFGLILWLELLFRTYGFQIKLWYVSAVIGIFNLEMTLFLGLLYFLGSVGFEFYIVFRTIRTLVAGIRLFKLMAIVIFLFNEFASVILIFDVENIALLILDISSGIKHIMVCLLFLRLIFELAPIKL